jgi:hypothetical protein
MNMAFGALDRPLDPLIAAVRIPPDHPAYSGATEPPRGGAGRRWSMTVATIVVLLSIAAISGGAAHYLLRIAEPAGAGAAAAPGLAAAIAVPSAPAPAVAEPPAAEPAAAPGPDIVLAAVPAPPPPVAAKRKPRHSVRSARLLMLAQRPKPALEPEPLDLAPQEAFLPAPIAALPPPIIRTPKADR